MSRAFHLWAVLLLAACAQAPAVTPAAAPAPAAESVIAPMPGADGKYGPGPALANPPPPGPAKEFVELENPADGTRIALKQGGELKLVIDARPMNQLQWKQVAPVEPTLSPIGDRIYVSKSTNFFDLKAGGWNIFRYRAGKPGTVKLVLELAATDVPQPSTRSVRYEVTVE
jgi:predicted secreted protein